MRIVGVVPDLPVCLVTLPEVVEQTDRVTFGDIPLEKGDVGGQNDPSLGCADLYGHTAGGVTSHPETSDSGQHLQLLVDEDQLFRRLAGDVADGSHGKQSLYIVVRPFFLDVL
jgi:hypothetical protein